MKINKHFEGVEGGFIHGLNLGYKNNCKFFFTLIVHDKMVNEDNFS